MNGMATVDFDTQDETDRHVSCLIHKEYATRK